MGSILTRIAGAAAFGLYTAILTFSSEWNGEDVDAVPVVLMFGLGTIIGYVIWPRVAVSRLRPTGTRIAGAFAIALVFALLMTLGFSLVPGLGGDRSTFSTSWLIGLLMAYLAWPGIEKEIVQKRGR